MTERGEGITDKENVARKEIRRVNRDEKMTETEVEREKNA